MTAERYGHTATLLSDGRVLVAGGGQCRGRLGDTCIIPTKTAELYDPASGSWTRTGNMNFGRIAHTATLLNDGRVLVAGGWYTTAELYDRASGTWTATSSMTAERYGHTATLLSDARVLVAGGYGVTAELFDPSTGTWTITGFMADAREGHTATLLTSGRVLVTGSGPQISDADDWPALATAEEYDPASGTWGSRTFMSTGRDRHTATLLNDGSVLVAGGPWATVANTIATTFLAT
jgi:N-acetylneuraminic acid mutarotase